MKLVARRNKSDSSVIKYRFEGAFTIYAVKKLKNVLMQELKSNKNVEIDMSGVQRIDTSGIQVLLHMKREAVKFDRKFIIKGIEGEVQKMTALYDIELSSN
ncbi:MAG: STAS domain-containing protein [Spirochaetes bacterium]|nr:STAS domain-containing protein [Spirochaetota bacterium]